MPMKKAPVIPILVLLFTRLVVAQLTVQTLSGLTGPTAESVSGSVNPVSCGRSGAPLWCNGSELGAWVNAAFRYCGFNCTVVIPPGSYSYTSTISMTKPTESLIGAGVYQTTLNYTGSGDGIVWQMKPFTVQKAGTLQGMTLRCTSSTINCVHSGTIQGSTWQDLVISGATGPSGVGVLLQNIAGPPPTWTERTYMHNVHIGESGVGNKIGLAFRVNGGSTSWEYSDFDVWFNVEAGQTGALVEFPATLTHSFVKFMGNIDSTSPTTSFLTVNGVLGDDIVNILAESVNGAHAKTIYVGSTGVVNSNGNVQVNANDATSTASIVPPVVARGGFYLVEPWVALDYVGSGSSPEIPQPRPMIQSGYHAISRDGTIVVAESPDLQGRLILSWPNNSNRMALMIIDVSCAQLDKACSLSVPVNYAYGGEAVFTEPTVKLTGGNPSLPQLQVTIGNRNGVSQNILASWYGAAGESPSLFPGTAVGTTEVKSYGFTFDDAGNLSFDGNKMIPSTVIGFHGSSGTKLQLSDGSGVNSGQAVFAGDGSLTNSTAGSAGHATCWKAVGQLGYCSTAFSSTGTCICN